MKLVRSFVTISVNCARVILSKMLAKRAFRHQSCERQGNLKSNRKDLQGFCRALLAGDASSRGCWIYSPFSQLRAHNPYLPFFDTGESIFPLSVYRRLGSINWIPME
jgi:hypothetical protein